MEQRFLLQILLLAQHVSGTTVPIIRSSRVLYSGCCLWYFVLWFSSCLSGVELRVMCPVCRMLQHPANRTHNPLRFQMFIFPFSLLAAVCFALSSVACGNRHCVKHIPKPRNPHSPPGPLSLADCCIASCELSALRSVQ